ncbi:ATP-binding protein [Streptomyces sp. NPDC006393]|uniref:ATP-binding protein n=1 Tax=Streptomyces sp. NPDC006393 TaxID=3156763 RepID=UPI0033E46430
MPMTGALLGLPTRDTEAEGPREEVPTSAAMTLHAEAALVRSVRRFADALLSLWRIGDETRDAAVLIVDELAVNAVEHGRTDMTLLLTLDGAILRMAVADTGAHAPRRGAGGDPDEHGRGVGIIQHLSERFEFHQSERRCLAYAWLRVQIRPGTSVEAGAAA